MPLRKERPPARLLDLLDHERYHSGERLAAELGISRSAVWKQLERLRHSGIEILATPGRGYRLARPYEPLSSSAIIEALPATSPARNCRLVVHDVVDSTNDELRRHKGGLATPTACLAEAQSHGRGRRGHHWHSPYGGNLYASLGLSVDQGPDALAGLGLVAGTATLAAIHAIGAEDCGLKWPNDCLWHGRKLAGLLIELSGACADRCEIIAGIGINVAMPSQATQSIDRPWCDLAEILGASPSRNRLAALLLHHLMEAFGTFSEHGLVPFVEAWRKDDLLRDQAIVVEQAGRTQAAIARGIDDRGALVIDTADGRQTVLAGDIHITRIPEPDVRVRS